MFAEHRSQRAPCWCLAPLQYSAVRSDYALAEIPISLEHEQLLDRSVPDLHANPKVSFSTSYNDFPSLAAFRIDASSCSANLTNEWPLISFCE